MGDGLSLGVPKLRCGVAVSLSLASIMQLFPYQSFGGIRLGSDEAAVIQLIDEPHRRSVNRLGELELEYKHTVVRLVNGRVVEITSRPASVTLDGVAVARFDLAEHLCAKDPQSKNLHGFVVSLQFGVAIDNDAENDGWISVFSKGRWDDLFYRDD